MTTPAIAYVNGEFTPQAEAKISIMDRGFLFADGIYEVSAVIDGKLVDNALHMARLERSVREIGLALPEPTARISEVMTELVRRNNLGEGLVYLQVTRGAEASRNFAFPANA
ncbi:MAG: aminotransferase class IV, partial [Beijerinckiaceae bacterium]